jgi:nitroreductase
MGTPPRPARRGRSTGPPIAVLERRRFLQLVAGAAAYGALRPHESWAKKLARPLPALQPWTLPPDPPSDPLELARALAGAAVLAPSQWNTQPWRLEANGSSVRLLADPRRSLPVTDPDRRGMMLSLGAALENLLVSMRAYGMRPTVTYFPEGDANAVAHVAWTHGDQRRDRDLFLAIPERRTNRREYDGRGLFMQNRAALSAVVPGDLRLYWIDDRDGLRDLADLAHDATHDRVMDRRAEAECFGWMRLDDDQARERGDGLTADDLELSGPARWFAGRYFHPQSRFLGLGAGSAGKQAREQIRSAGALALLTTPRPDPAAWVAAGQTYQRLALRATRLGIAHQPINAPVDVPRYRGDVLRAFGAIAEQPLMLLRLGHAKRPRPSMRRGVALVTSFRAS